MVLAERPETEATGRTADIYEAIRAASGVDMVSMIYRHIAVEPAHLEWAWRIMGPEMMSGRVADMAATLTGKSVADRFRPRLATLPTPPDLGPDVADRVTAVADAFNRANPVNYLFVNVLINLLGHEAPRGDPRTEPDLLGPDAWDRPGIRIELPPIVALKDMTPELRARMLAMADLGVGKLDRIVPSLYRHVAHWPEYVAYIHDVLTQDGIFELIDAAAAEFRAGAQDAVDLLMVDCVARDLESGRPTGRARSDYLVSLLSFQPRIPMMVAIGTLLRLVQAA